MSEGPRKDGGTPALSARWRWWMLASLGLQWALIAFVAGVGYLQLHSAQREIQSLSERQLRKQALTKTMRASSMQRTLLLLRLVLQEDPFERDSLQQRYEALGGVFAETLRELLSLAPSEVERELLKSQANLIGEVLPKQRRVIDLAFKDRLQDAAGVLLTDVIPVQEALLESLTALEQASERDARRVAAQLAHEYRIGQRWILGLAAAALMLGVLVALLALRQLHYAQREREHLALHDALTGLPNRMLLMLRLEQALAGAQRRAVKVGVLWIDLDKFKVVNDTLGHAAGDELLCAMAARMSSSVRSHDTVARVGGDEFVVVIEDAPDVPAIVRVCERILGALTRPVFIAGRELSAGGSIGISVFPDDGGSAELLLKHADIAMYRAKQSGRGRFQLFCEAVRRDDLEQSVGPG